MSTIVVDSDQALEEAQRDFLKKVCLFFFGQDSFFLNSLSDSHAKPSIASKCFSHEKTRHIRKYVCPPLLR